MSERKETPNERSRHKHPIKKLWRRREDKPKEKPGKETPRKKWVSRRELLGYALVIPPAAIAAGGLIDNGDPLSLVKRAEDWLTQETAPPVSEAEIAHARSIIHEPMDDREKEFRATLTGRFAEDYGRIYQYMNSVAREEGLTIRDASPTIGAVQGAKSQKEVISKINDFTAHYGFEITLGEERNPLRDPSDYRAVDPEVLDLEGLKQASKQWIAIISIIPEEVFESVNLKKIKLGTLDDESKGAMRSANGVMYLDLSDNKFLAKSLGKEPVAGEDRIILHELGHELDQEISSHRGMEDDPAISRLLPPGFRFEHEDRDKVFDDVIGKVLPDAYGGKNMAELKAEFFERILGGIDPRLFEKGRETPLAQMTYLLTARLAQRLQRKGLQGSITRYLTKLGRSSNHITEFPTSQIRLTEGDHQYVDDTVGTIYTDLANTLWEKKEPFQWEVNDNLVSGTITEEPFIYTLESNLPQEQEHITSTYGTHISLSWGDVAAPEQNSIYLGKSDDGSYVIGVMHESVGPEYATGDEPFFSPYDAQRLSQKVDKVLMAAEGFTQPPSLADWVPD
ncbi:MAG: hypothetical protein AAB553_00875 [Patescibacteria group bacterium]